MTREERKRIPTDTLYACSLRILCLLGTNRGKQFTVRRIAQILYGSPASTTWIDTCLVQLERAGLVCRNTGGKSGIKLTCSIELEKLPTSGRFVQLEQRPAQLRRREGK